jgi:hypothetical protein
MSCTHAAVMHADHLAPVAVRSPSPRLILVESRIHRLARYYKVQWTLHAPHTLRLSCLLACRACRACVASLFAFLCLSCLPVCSAGGCCRCGGPPWATRVRAWSFGCLGCEEPCRLSMHVVLVAAALLTLSCAVLRPHNVTPAFAAPVVVTTQRTK